METETLEHLYKCPCTGSHNQCKTTVTKLLKWIPKQHIDTNISYLFEASLLYLYGKENNIPKFEYQSLHSDILQVGWPSIILSILPVSLIKT